MSNYKRQHPFSIIIYIWKFAILLIFPLIRGFLASFSGGFKLWAEGAWFDILTVTLIITFGAIKWLGVSYFIDDQEISIKKGIIKRQKFSVKLKNVTTFSAVDKFYLRPFNVSVMFFDTPAGSKRKADIMIIINKKLSDNIINNQIKFFNKTNYSKTYKTKNIYLLLISAITSNSFAGILFLATFISQMGKMLGSEVSNRIYGTFQELANKISFGLPPATAAIAYVLILGWLLAFFLNAIRYHNFFVVAKDRTIVIKNGLFTNRQYVLNKEKMTYIDISQTILTKICNFVSVFIISIGYGKNSNNMSALIPAITKENLEEVLGDILPNHKKSNLTVRPMKYGFVSFVYIPILIMIGIALTRKYFLENIIILDNIFEYVSFMLYLPAIWFFIVRILDFLSCGIGKEQDFYTLCYSKNYSLHKVIIEKNKIASVKIVSNPIQKLFGVCNVCVNSFSEGTKKHYLRNLKTSKVMDIFNIT